MTHNASGFGKKGRRECYTDNLPLNQRRPSSKVLLDDAEEDVHPDSDASFLRKHLDDDNDDGNESSLDKSLLSILKSPIAFMSRTPLLSRSEHSQGIGPYSTQSSGSLITEEDDSEPEPYGTDHVRSRDRRKGKTRTWLAADSPSPESREASGIEAPPQDEATSSEDFETLLGNKPANKAITSGDEAVDIDDKTSRWNDENPFDNSPLVTPLLIRYTTLCAFPSHLICQRGDFLLSFYHS